MTLLSLQMFNSDIQRSSRFLLFFHPSHGNHLQSPAASLSGCPTQVIYLLFPAVSFSTCPSSLSVAEIRHWPEGTLGGTGCLVYMSKPSLRAGTQAEAGTAEKSCLLACFQGHIRLACWFLPGLIAQMILPLWAGPSHINQRSWKCHTELPTGQFWGGHFLPSGFPDPERLQFVLVFVNRLYRDLALVFLPPAPCSLS